MGKQHATAVINGHGVINKEEGKRGDAYQRTTTNGQRGGDGGGDNDEGRREKYNLLHEGFFKLGASLMVVLVCFVKGLVNIYREKNFTYPCQLVIWY